MPFLLLACTAVQSSPTPVSGESTPLPVQSFADDEAESVWRALSERADKLDRFAMTLEMTTTLSDEVFTRQREALLELEIVAHQARGKTLTDQEREGILIQIAKKRVTRLFVARDGPRWRTTFEMVKPPLIVHMKGYDVVAGFEEDAACDGVEVRLVRRPKGPARIALVSGDRLGALYSMPWALRTLAGNSGLDNAERAGARWRIIGRELVNGTECVILEGESAYRSFYGNRWRYWLAPRLGHLPLRLIREDRRWDGSIHEVTTQIRRQFELSSGVWVASLFVTESRMSEPSVGPVEMTTVLKVSHVHSLRKSLPDELFRLSFPPEMPVEDMRQRIDQPVQ